MAISRVAVTNIAARGSSTSYTISHAGGDCDAVFVFVRRVDPTSLTSMTYGGVSLTQLVEVSDANNHRHSIWGLKDCASGTQNLVVTAPNSTQTHIGIATYKGVSKTATFPNVSNTGTNLLTTLNVAVTTTVDNCVLLGIGGHTGLAADEQGVGGGTARFSLYNNGGGFDDGALESDPLHTGVANSKSLEITLGASGQDMSLAVIAIAPDTTSASDTIKCLVVAGGGQGGAGSGSGAGGGAGGGVIYDPAYVVTPQTYTVTVGGTGQDSVFGTIVAIAGGQGADSGNSAGSNGGSGGGGRGSGIGGTARQGFNGGAGHAATASGGGGGGAGEVGANGTLGGGAGLGGDGGDGVSNSITGSAVTYAGGGGGAANGGGGNGGAGGGGTGGGPGDGTNGTANTGGGGGGDSSVRRNGGSGIVILSYVTANFGPCTGGTITTDGANTIHSFTSSGTFTLKLNTSRFFNCM